MNSKFFALFCTTLVIAFSTLMVEANENKFALQRTTIGQPVDHPLTWNVVNKPPKAKRFLLTIKNLRKGGQKTKCLQTLDDLVKGVKISDFFPDTLEGIYTVKLQAFVKDECVAGDNKHETDEIIQILGPSTTEVDPEFTECETTENRKEPYDVIVVDGTSAGIGAAITAAREGLSTCLLESTSLLGGMLTNGIGSTDISFYGSKDVISHDWKLEPDDIESSRPYLSYGLMDQLRQKVEEIITSDKNKNNQYYADLDKLSKYTFGISGLQYTPSLIREALYELVKNAVDEKKLHVTLNSPFSSRIEKTEYTTKKGKKYDCFKIFKTTTGTEYFLAKYVVDATDSGDVAVSYAKHLNEFNKNVDYCKQLNSDKLKKVKDTNDYITEDEPPTSNPSTSCVREPTQAYSYVMTIQRHQDKNSNWSYMSQKPPYCENNGEYTNDFLTKGLELDPDSDKYKNSHNHWTISSGLLGKNLFQVKHHSTRETYKGNKYKSEKGGCQTTSSNYFKLGDELIDCDVNNVGLDYGYATKNHDGERIAIVDRYVNHAMCFLYQMQHHDGVEKLQIYDGKNNTLVHLFPPAQKKTENDITTLSDSFKGTQVGLTNLEDLLRGNFPARLYVREGRRINGKETFTGKDVQKRYFIEKEGKKVANTTKTIRPHGRPDQERKKMKHGIGITTYPMDSHAISLDEHGHGEIPPGQMDKITGPGVIPLGVMIPFNDSMKNILVPLAASSGTWGQSVLRMEPTRLNMGWAAALAIKLANKQKISPRDLLEVENAGLLFQLQKKLIFGVSEEKNGQKYQYAGKVFLYLDPEFYNTDKGKKQHMAAQFLGIWGIDSGYEFKDSPYTFKPGNKLLYGKLSTMVKNALESLKRHTEAKLGEYLGEKEITNYKERLAKYQCHFLNLQTSNLQKSDSSLKDILKKTKRVQFLCKYTNSKAACDSFSDENIKELCTQKVITAVKQEEKFRSTLTDYIDPGYSDGSSVSDNEEVTKGHFARMIANAFGLPKAEVKDVCSDKKNAYCSYLEKLVGNKIFSQTKIDLAAKITRGEAALAICNAYVFATGWDDDNLCKYE